MKEIYEKPEIKTIVFDIEDVIVTSGPNSNTTVPGEETDDGDND